MRYIVFKTSAHVFWKYKFYGRSKRIDTILECSMNQTSTEKKKKNRKVLAFLLCAAMAVTCIAGGVMAKYTTNVSGSDKASVAKWAFRVNDVDMTPTGNDAEMTFDLFNTIKDTDGVSAEGDVKANLIAPGTSGSFDVKIENLSEVNAVYALDYTIVNSNNVPLQFSVNGSDWKNDINDLDVSNVPLAMEGGSDTVTVHWRWVFNGDDNTDTSLGIMAAKGTAPSVEVTCSSTFTQVD